MNIFSIFLNLRRRRQLALHLGAACRCSVSALPDAAWLLRCSCDRPWSGPSARACPQARAATPVSLQEMQRRPWQQLAVDGFDLVR
jgi:hypothetical protein